MTCILARGFEGNVCRLGGSRERLLGGLGVGGGEAWWGEEGFGEVFGSARCFRGPSGENERVSKRALRSTLEGTYV